MNQGIPQLLLVKSCGHPLTELHERKVAKEMAKQGKKPAVCKNVGGGVKMFKLCCLKASGICIETFLIRVVLHNKAR